MNIKLNSCLVALLLVMGISVAEGQVSELMRGAKQAGKSVTKAPVRPVRQIPLTVLEREILPVRGIASHRIYYTGKEARVTPLLHHEKAPVAQIIDKGTSWKLKHYNPTLPYDLFPKYAKLDAQALTQAYKFSMDNFEKWAPFETEFLKQLRMEVYRDIPWKEYLPDGSVDFIFLGEKHFHAGTYRTVLQVVEALKKNNPDRKVIFATEYVSDTLEKSTFADTPDLLWVRTADELRNALATKEEMVFNFLEKILKLDIEIVGIEPTQAVTNAFLEERGLTRMTSAEKDHRYRFGGSVAVVNERNLKWVEHLKQLQAQNPDAIIVVHCGATHSSRNVLASVPNLLGEDNTFIIQILPWQELLHVSPAFYVEVTAMDLARELVQLGPRQVFSLKPSIKELPADKQQLFKTALGADMVISLTR